MLYIMVHSLTSVVHLMVFHTGPEQFQVYGDDLDCINENAAILMEADDTNIFVKGPNLNHSFGIMNQK